MNKIEVVQTAYPRLLQILDEESLAALATLESREQEFITQTGGPRHQYLKALYLKAMLYLGHSRFAPSRTPRQLRLRLTEQLGLPRNLPISVK